jgi:hypothetical protein
MRHHVFRFQENDILLILPNVDVFCKEINVDIDTYAQLFEDA